MSKKRAAIARQKSFAAAKRASQKAAVSENYLTVREAAELLKMSESHVYFLKHQKRIPYLKLGGKLLFEREALKKWLDSNFQPSLPFERKPRKKREPQKKREQYYDVTTGQMVDAPKTEVELKKEIKPAIDLRRDTVLELGHLQIQIFRSDKGISIIPDMEGDAIDLSAGICSLMMKNPVYRKIIETGVLMYSSFQNP